MIEFINVKLLASGIRRHESLMWLSSTLDALEVVVARIVHMLGHVAYLFAISFIAATMTACQSFSVSRAYVDPQSGWRTQMSGRSQQLSGSEVVILVGAANLRSTSMDETKKDYFRVALSFYAKGDDLDVDPNGFVLVLSPDTQLRPAHIEAMSGGWADGYCQQCLKCGIEPAPRYPLRGLCVNLYFETQPPSPDKEFSLRVPDILGKKSEQRLPVPEILFSKGTGAFSILTR